MTALLFYRVDYLAFSGRHFFVEMVGLPRAQAVPPLNLRQTMGERAGRTLLRNWTPKTRGKS